MRQRGPVVAVAPRALGRQGRWRGSLWCTCVMVSWHCSWRWDVAGREPHRKNGSPACPQATEEAGHSTPVRIPCPPGDEGVGFGLLMS